MVQAVGVLRTQGIDFLKFSSFGYKLLITSKPRTLKSRMERKMYLLDNAFTPLFK